MKKVAIIGAGISGLFIANLFKNNSNYEIKIFEKDKLINLDEGYGIQLSVNSVRLLNKIEFHKFQNDKKFNPCRINFYSIKSTKKICDLDISYFNSKFSRIFLVIYLLLNLTSIFSVDIITSLKVTFTSVF